MTKSYYKVLKSEAVILRKRVGQVGEFMGWIGCMIQLQFADGEVLCCFETEVEQVTKGQWKKQRMLNQLETIGRNPILFGQILGSVLD